jgi:hypothetical protein
MSVNESQCNATYVDYNSEPHPDPYSNPAFWWVLLLAPTQNFLYSSVRVIIDTGTMNILGESRKEHYGKQRLWGSVRVGDGWEVFVFVVAVCCFSTSLEPHHQIGYACLAALSTTIISKTCNLYSLFYTFAICNVIFIAVIGPFDPKAERVVSSLGSIILSLFRFIDLTSPFVYFRSLAHSVGYDSRWRGYLLEASVVASEW